MLWNPRADERTDETAGRAARTRSGQCRRQRPRYHKPQTRQHNVRPDRDYGRHPRAHRPADGRAVAQPVGRMRARLDGELLRLGRVGHKHRDVVARVTALENRINGCLRRHTRLENSRHKFSHDKDSFAVLALRETYPTEHTASPVPTSRPRTLFKSSSDRTNYAVRVRRDSARTRTKPERACAPVFCSASASAPATARVRAGIIPAF